MHTKGWLMRAMMQKNSLSFEQGDIVVADIVYSQQFGFKRRPVLVVSNDEYNLTSFDIIVVSISSTEPRSDYEIKLAKADVAEGELRAESKIVVDFASTIEKHLVKQKIGRISDRKMREVKQKMKELYAL